MFTYIANISLNSQNFYEGLFGNIYQKQQMNTLWSSSSTCRNLSYRYESRVTRLFTRAQFVTIKFWKEFKCPSIGNSLWDSHRIEYNAAIKKKKRKELCPNEESSPRYNAKCSEMCQVCYHLHNNIELITTYNLVVYA